MQEKFTLQINLSPGDIGYALNTVPALIDHHVNQASEILLIVDCCKPQSSKFFNSDDRFPANEFQARCEKITEIADLIATRYAGTIVKKLLPEDAVHRKLSSKYTAGVVNASHDSGGCGLMSYFLGIDSAHEEYIVHYDADMFLYQAPDYSWVQAGISELRTDDSLIFCSPRTAAPLDDSSILTLHEKRPFRRQGRGFINDWFSTRCFLTSKSRLQSALPLYVGVGLLSALVKKFLVDVLPVPRKVENRRSLPGFFRYLYWRAYPVFPVAPEILFFNRFAQCGLRTLYLESTKSFLMHPLEKGDVFLNSVPTILEAFRSGKVPANQRGFADYVPEAWNSIQ